jgi:hypothetical protein
MNVMPVCYFPSNISFAHLFCLAIVEARTATNERDSLRERLRVKKKEN